MSTISITDSATARKKLVVNKSISHQRKMSSLLKSRKEIQNSKEKTEIFDWIERTFKSLGFYRFKSTLGNDDERLALILECSRNTIKNYRIRNGQVPRPKMLTKIKNLEKSLTANVYITKLEVRPKNQSKETKNGNNS